MRRPWTSHVGWTRSNRRRSGIWARTWVSSGSTCSDAGRILEWSGFAPAPADADWPDHTIAPNGLADQWHAVRACSSWNGIARVVGGLLSESRIAVSGHSNVVEAPMIDAFDACWDAELVKIDIEGAE